VLVGHSYGGAVITQAGVNPKVHSLVYVAAYAPEVGRSVLDTQKPYPDAPGRPFIVKDDAGYLKFTDEGIFDYFARRFAHCPTVTRDAFNLLRACGETSILTAIVGSSIKQEKANGVEMAGGFSVSGKNS